jgi:Zn-dependent protease
VGILFGTIAVFVLFLFSAIAHEVAHGYAALLCGDPTAREAGRLNFNPLVHIDPFYSILMPIFCYFTLGYPFGGGKPVPVNPMFFRNRRRDDIIVSLAGVATNFLIAAVLSLLIRIPLLAPEGSINQVVLGMGIVINLTLGVFNLIPIPPLDGSHVLKYLLPERLRAPYEAVGFFGIVVIALLIGVSYFRNFLLLALVLCIRLLGLDPEFLLVNVVSRFHG